MTVYWTFLKVRVRSRRLSWRLLVMERPLVERLLCLGGYLAHAYADLSGHLVGELEHCLLSLFQFQSLGWAVQDFES
jgi:hypothetical protein